MADPLTTVATSWYLEDIAVQRTALDAASIRNFADDSFVVNLNWLFANAVGGIKLRVPGEELESAAEVLGGATEIGEPEPFEEPAESCEACGSAGFQPIRKWPAFFAVGIVLFGATVAAGQALAGLFAVLAALLITFIAPSRRCAECNEPW